MARTKLYKLIIAALILINVGILIFFLAGGPPHSPPKAGDLADKLGLEGATIELVTNLEKNHHVKKRALMKTDRELHEELFSKIGTDADVRVIHDEIEGNFAETEKMTYSFFNEVSKHCTAEQKVELKKMIHRAFRQMKGPRK